jgi:protocatechuate 3,4-dioxygenase beta subunit
MRTLLGLALTLPLILGGQNENKQWTVEGGVTTDNGPVKGARIGVSGPTPLEDVFTNEKGEYVLKGTEPGVFLLRASMQGTAESKPRALRMLPGTHQTSINFKLAKEAVIAGRVLDAEKKPVPGAIVTACVKAYRDGRLRLQPKQYSTTDDLGEYRIADLSEGKYILSIAPKKLVPRKRALGPSRAGAEPKRLITSVRNAFYPGVQSLESAAPIMLYEGEQHGGADIVLPSAESFCVRATVVASSGESSASLWLVQPVGDSFPTVANGSVSPGEEYEICSLTPGRYRLLASTWDPETKKAAAFVRTDFVVGTRDAGLGNLYPRPGIAVQGKLTVVAAKPEDPLPGGLTVTLERRGRPILYGENLVAAVKSDGSFGIENVFTDEYGLTVSGLPDGYYLSGASQQGLNVTRGPIQPGRGELLISIGSDAAAIRGRTVDKDANPVPDATVILLPSKRLETDPILTRQSDNNGAFEFTSLEPGKYQILALTGLYAGEASDPAFVANHTSLASEVEVAAKESRNVNLKVNNGH